MNLHVNFMSSQALTKTAGFARMWKIRKVCSSKCMGVFCFSTFPCFGDSKFQVSQAQVSQTQHGHTIASQSTQLKKKASIHSQWPIYPTRIAFV